MIDIYILGIISYTIYYSILFIIYKIIPKIKTPEKITILKNDIKLNLILSIFSWLSFITILITTFVALNNKEHKNSLLYIKNE